MIDHKMEDVIVATHELLRALIKVEMLDNEQFSELEDRITVSGYELKQAYALIAFLKSMREWDND